MAKVEWVITCDYASMDSAGKVSVVGIFEKITSLHIPAVHPILFSVIKLIGDPGEKVKFELVIEDPKKEVLAKFPIENFEFKDTGAIVFTQFRFITFKEFGTYILRTFLNGIEKNQKELFFVKVAGGE